VYKEAVSVKFTGAFVFETYCCPVNVFEPVVAKVVEFEPPIVPVDVTAPEELIAIRVVEPLTNVTLPLASVFMMLAKPLISLTLLILVYVVAF
jgi:hypothetical protein